jgi:hypothetical protein
VINVDLINGGIMSVNPMIQLGNVANTFRNNHAMGKASYVVCSKSKDGQYTWTVSDTKPSSHSAVQTLKLMKEFVDANKQFLTEDQRADIRFVAKKIDRGLTGKIAEPKFSRALEGIKILVGILIKGAIKSEKDIVHDTSKEIVDILNNQAIQTKGQGTKVHIPKNKEEFLKQYAVRMGSEDFVNELNNTCLLIDNDISKVITQYVKDVNKGDLSKEDFRKNLNGVIDLYKESSLGFTVEQRLIANIILKEKLAQFENDYNAQVGKALQAADLIISGTTDLDLVKNAFNKILDLNKQIVGKETLNKNLEDRRAIKKPNVVKQGINTTGESILGKERYTALKNFITGKKR